ncbi:ACT domain-containing protein [Undibacterium sp. Jales W-56]|uniref:ACT domain-containing protein n=1 Tax=Undibacterium sp. Jales W-56 TaxID=2897325 RepID=UPI0021D14A64|nr:ACT domain-containing protein [Undibacterium sp. Jales W-56]MCU6434015.1 ACT domain-containing protein [Undibacterium sp. Jales W-56]
MTSYKPISDLPTLLSSMEPVLNEGRYAYVCVPMAFDWRDIHIIAAIREIEGMTLVVPEAEAERLGLTILFRAAWITLNVHSDLQAVGLTAAFAQALGAANISCNVIAGACHDHIFIPVEQASAAMMALQKLQMTSAK